MSQTNEDVALLADLARARGRAGRWPDGRFEDDDAWFEDGMVIDELAAVLDQPTEDLLAIYREAHMEGLRQRNGGKG